MNCQEFRAIRLQDADEIALSHVETCDSCLDWIESTLSGHEEVQFMKEFPQPSKQLEDKIMQSIYASIELAGIPPLTATEQSQPARRWRRIPPLAWTGAVAGVIVAIGIFSFQLANQPPKSDLFAHSSTSSGAAPAAADSAAESEATGNQLTMMESSTEEIALHNQTALHEPVEAAALAPSQPQPDTAQAAPAEVVLSSDREQMAVAKPPASPPPAAKQQAETPAVSKPADETITPPSLDHAVAIDNRQRQATSRGQNGFATGEQANNESEHQLGATEAEPLNGIASLGEDYSEDYVEQAGAQPERQETTPITISTFTDLKTAGSISNLAIPYLGKQPDGFTLKTVSLRFQSETSNNVVAVRTVYSRNQDTISLSVERNDEAQRSLSIPGTFIDRRIFTIGEDQAIAVTYDPEASDVASEHEIHVITSYDQIPLYVVMKASGISLDTFIESAKNLSWHTALPANPTP